MNSRDIVENMLHHKKYDAVTEFAKIEHPDRGSLVITEYAGSIVSAYKDDNGVTKVMVPRSMDLVQEGTVATEIANGTIFDDAEEATNNAEMIEKLSIPYNAMVNSGKDTPKKLKPMIAIVIGKLDTPEDVGVSDSDRTTGHNFVRDLIECNDKKCSVDDVVDNYIGKDKESFHTPEMGHDVADLNKEVSDIQDTKSEDVISDDDTVEDYGGKIPQSGDFDDYPDNDETDDDTNDSIEDDNLDDKMESEEEEDEDTDDYDSESEDNADEDDKDNEDVVDECVKESVESEYNPNTIRQFDDVYDEEETNAIQEAFFSKKPKKLKPIPRDVVAYITVEMNAISSSNDQAMLSGYTCSKIELVDFYLTVLDTQDPRYIVPHTKQYLETMKRDLENLLTQILRIRPINRNDRIWRVNVNYPEGRM